MKDRTSKPDRSNMTNIRPATCEHCEAALKPGAGFVWFCLGAAGECENEVHIDHGGGAHIRCRDSRACHGRATKAAGGRSKRAALASAAKARPATTPATPQIATESHEEEEGRTLTPQNAPERVQGPLRRNEVMVPGPPMGTYVGAPERRDCPRGHSGATLSAGIVRVFTRTGVDEYVCDGCGASFWVWRCCGVVSFVEPAVSSVYRDPASALCPGCGENRFEVEHGNHEQA